MSFDGIQQYVQGKARVVIDLRTMRPSEKQEVVDATKREYVRQSTNWVPTDRTEQWIKHSRSDELFLEYIARQLAEDEQRQVVWRLGNQVEYDTLAHPLIEVFNAPDDSGGDIDKA